MRLTRLRPSPRTIDGAGLAGTILGAERLAEARRTTSNTVPCRAELGERSGYEAAGGSFARYLSTLKSADLIVTTRPGSFALAHAIQP